MLRIGAWCINPASGQISRNGETARVEVRTMRLLLCLAQHAGEVVSIDDLLDLVWSDVTVAPDSVYQAVTSLRRLLGDDPKQPTYIATVPRLGTRVSDGGHGQSLDGAVRRPDGHAGKRTKGRTDERADGLFAGFGRRTFKPRDH